MKNASLVVGLIVLLGLLLSWNRLFPTTQTVLITNPADLPGIQTGDAPWSPEIANLRARLTDIGLPALNTEGSALHIHQHLDLVINGTPIAVPSSIGINQQANFISPIHTHDASGVIHVESPTVQDFTLGQFFDIWGVRFTKDAIGGYTNSATSTLSVYVNGSLIPGDPRSLVLAEHQEIMIVYGTKEQAPKTIITSYSFPSGE